MQGITHVLHTATLHKPHVATHEQQQFIDTNITGTLNLLEASVENGVRSFIFTSTTSTFGDALTPGPEAAGGLDHRRGSSHSQEYIRRNKNRRRRSLPVVLSQSEIALSCFEDLPFFPGRR